MFDSFIQTDWLMVITKLVLATCLGYLMGAGMFAEAILGTIIIMTVNICFKHLREHKEEHKEENKEEK